QASSSTSLLEDPVADVRRAVENVDPSGFAGPEEPNHLNVDQSHLLQIQRHIRSARVDLPLDLTQVLGLHSTDKSNRRAAPVRILFDSPPHGGAARPGRR